jgi:two-component system sensor histidine kinase TctE
VPAAIARGLDLGFEAAVAPRSGRSAPAPIAGQPVLLRELLSNLIDNALRYTPRGGAVTVRVVGRAEGTDLEVEDNGPGVPEVDRTMVFERFYRVLGTGVDGSGLGLAIVREIADQHGATVEVVAAYPGHDPPGALFRVRFPAAATPPAPPRPGPAGVL